VTLQVTGSLQVTGPVGVQVMLLGKPQLMLQFDGQGAGMGTKDVAVTVIVTVEFGGGVGHVGPVRQVRHSVVMLPMKVLIVVMNDVVPTWQTGEGTVMVVFAGHVEDEQVVTVTGGRVMVV